MGFEAVSNTGPIIHLDELRASAALKTCRTCTTQEVSDELKGHNICCPLRQIHIDPDKAAFFQLKHNIGPGEASCIALCLQERISLFFTDDLSARAAAHAEGIEAHGTIGILLRAFRERIFSKAQALGFLKNMKQKSSLFITQWLVNQAVRAVRRFRRPP